MKTLLILLSTCFLGIACGPAEPPAPVEETAPAAEVAQTDETEEIEPAPEPEPYPPGLAPFVAPWKGDLDGMIERRVIRVLTVESPVQYFIDKGRELGITYEGAKAFETQLNEKLGTGNVKIHVIVMPVGRDELIPRLLAGQGDIAAATLTVTPERKQQVDFSDPFGSNVSEIVVTGPAGVDIATVDELSGKEVHVRASSSYAEHLKALNQRFASEGKAPVQIVRRGRAPRGRGSPRDGRRRAHSRHRSRQLHGRSLGSMCSPL